MMKAYKTSAYLLLGIIIILCGGCDNTTSDSNTSPVITSLMIDGNSFNFGDTLTLTVVAEDPDDDLLIYSWSENNDLGQFLSTSEASVQWVANFAVAASAIFKVSVSDGDLSTSASDGVTISSADQPEFHFVGSSTCKQCHAEQYAEFIESGHPYKFNFSDGNEAPSYPNFVEESRVLNLPTGASSWNDILGVIGGFGWKARFVDNTGNIVGTANSVINTGGGQNQYNFFSGTDWGWVDYHTTDVKEYNYGCFRCHTTGATETGEWLPDVYGTFAYGGVQCERCHGQGSKHVESMGAGYIDLPAGDEVTELCGQCHYRNSDHSVAVSSGFTKHHEQYDEFIHTNHYENAGMNCSTCHDPHKRVIWDGDGIIEECTTCHGGVSINTPHDAVSCTSCHMAKTAKSAVQTVAGYQGDIHSHTFAIAADTSWNMYSDDGKTMRLDDNDHTKLSVANVCYGCHADANGGGGTVAPAKTLGELNDYLLSIH
ncbi:MAG: multiheme c-type cytochrome [Fidelibacterota bacterium]